MKESRYISLISTVLLGGFIISFWSACAPTDSDHALRQNIIREFTSQKGVFALAFKDLTSGDTLLINADDRFHAASTMKTPVMIEVFKQAQSGGPQLTDSIIIKNTFFSIVDSSVYQLTAEDDSEKGLYELIGEKRSLFDLVYDMIIVSSNLATNLVIDLVGAEAVTQSMRDLGARDIEVLRGVEDIKAYRQGLSNTTTARDLLTIYEKLARGEVVSREASSAMIDILKDQRFDEIIPAQLPENVEVAHKTGVITGLHHDSGIVELPDGRRYVLVMLSREMEDFDGGTSMMARVSKLVYDYVVRDSS